MAKWHRRIDATFRPIDRWPGERTQQPQRSRFRAGWSDTLATLKHELWTRYLRRLLRHLEIDRDIADMAAEREPETTAQAEDG